MNFFINARPRTGAHLRSKMLFLSEATAQKVSTYKAYNRKLHLKVVFHFREEYSGDIDNLLKSLLDYLQTAGFLKNDNLVRKVTASIEDSSLLEGISVRMVGL